MAHLLHINDDQAIRVQGTTMAVEGLLETKHLEQWIVQNPDVIDDGLKIIATQYRSWASAEGRAAREALDVLALASSGQTVVMELKRGGDPKIHLQAITYGALVAGFDRQRLAEAHAQWQRRRGQEITTEEALTQLTEHLESGWDDEILKLPRLVLIAERFPDQVLTTVQWLTSTVAKTLEIECHEYALFKSGGEVLVNVTKRFPVEDPESWTLRPTSGVNSERVRERIITRERRVRSVRVIATRHRIPDGDRIDLDLKNLVTPDVMAKVDAWLDEVPERREITWVNDPTKPLMWAAADDSTRQWTPTALRDAVFAQAMVDPATFSAADAWCYEGKNLYEIANEILARELEESE